MVAIKRTKLFTINLNINLKIDDSLVLLHIVLNIKFYKKNEIQSYNIACGNDGWLARVFKQNVEKFHSECIHTNFHTSIGYAQDSPKIQTLFQKKLRLLNRPAY